MWRHSSVSRTLHRYFVFFTNVSLSESYSAMWFKDMPRFLRKMSFHFSETVSYFVILGTLRFTAAGSYYGFFGREALGWQLRFLRKPQTDWDFAERYGIQHLRVFTKIRIGSALLYFHILLSYIYFIFHILLFILSYRKCLISDNCFLLLCPSYITQNLDFPRSCYWNRL